MSSTDGRRRSAGRESRRARLRARAGRLFSLRAFLVALALAAGGLLLASAVVPGVVPLGGLLGVAAATFALGLAGRRRYAECALAGAAVAALALLFGHLVLSLVGGSAVGATVAAVGGAGGAVAAVLGHYLGRDLRAGLVGELD